jgi:DHA1 family bicyclomycin/chloramphenicol resistance-like MFS transporter
MPISAYAKNAVVLGVIASVGPSAIAMYLPLAPSIAAGVHVSAAAIQMSLMAFFAAYGACQILFGPASDLISDPPPVLSGLALFLLGSIGSGLAPDLAWLLAFRLAQGVGVYRLRRLLAEFALD